MPDADLSARRCFRRFAKTLIEHRGRVIERSGGTGAALCRAPEQNATADRIEIRRDPGRLADHTLRMGLFMNADITVSR